MDPIEKQARMARLQESKNFREATEAYNELGDVIKFLKTGENSSQAAGRIINLVEKLQNIEGLIDSPRAVDACRQLREDLQKGSSVLDEDPIEYSHILGIIHSNLTGKILK